MGAADREGDVPRGGRLRELGDALKAIAADYGQAPTDDERRRFGREQLMEITLHLQRAGVPADALRPATAVIHGLIDVDRGIIPPILHTKRRRGGRSIPFDELNQRGLAAAAVTMLMRADEAGGRDEQKLERAARKVARRVQGWRGARRRRVMKNREQSLPEAVKDWRERAMRGRPGEHEDAGMYAFLLEEARDGRPPAKWAEWILTEGYKPYR